MSGIDGYLNDHLAGAAAAIRLAERCRASGWIHLWSRMSKPRERTGKGEGTGMEEPDPYRHQKPSVDTSPGLDPVLSPRPPRTINHSRRRGKQAHDTRLRARCLAVSRARRIGCSGAVLVGMPREDERQLGNRGNGQHEPAPHGEPMV
jgi:hypothetical protein